jgi:PAS domain S-box-containing protein
MGVVRRIGPSHSRSALLRYGSVVIALGLATLVGRVLDPVLGERVPYPAYFMAIMFVAWYGGLRPSLLAAFASALLADYLFISPRREILSQLPGDAVAFGLYVLAGATIAVLSQSLAVSRRRREASETRHENLVDSLQEGILGIDRDGRIAFANPYISKLFGYSGEDMLGQDVAVVLGEPVKALWQRALGRANGDREATLEMEIRRADGKSASINLAASLVTDDDGHTTEAVFTVIDVTERKRAEEITRADERRLRSVLKVSQRHTGSVRELLDYALDEALVLAESMFGYIYYYSEDKEEFTLHAWSKGVLQECTVLNPPRVYQLSRTGLWGEPVRQRQPIIVNDFCAPNPLKKGYPQGHAPLLRYMSLPVVSDGRIVAVIGVANKPTDYTDTDLRQLTLMMDSVWEIAERTRADEELARELTVNRAMSELSGALIAVTSSMKEITDITLHYAKLLTGSIHGFVSIIDPQTGNSISETLTAMVQSECLLRGESQRITFAIGPDGRYPRLWGHSLNTRRPFFTNAPATHEAAGGVPDGHIPLKNFLSVPAMLGERLVGQISLANSERDYTDEDVEVVVRLARLYAVALGRRETEDTLMRANTYNRSLIEASVDPLVTIGLDGKITDVNAATEEATGCPRAQLLGTDFSNYFTDQEQAREGYQRVFREGGVRDYALELKHRDGRVKSVLYNASTYHDPAGQVIGAFAAARDITERKRAEEAVRVLAGKLLTAQEEERSRIAREMHDDLTQRIAVLAIEAGKLEQESSDCEPLSGKLQGMKAQLIRLSEDVHALSRQLHPSILDDLGLADALRSECASFAQREGIAVRFTPQKIPAGIPREVALCLYRIAQEALRNIAKHSTAREARVALTAADDSILLSIQDAGVGFRADQPHGKFGLGLASMEERVRLIDGELTIRSEPGEGTLVEVWAPCSEKTP